jgi:hypothetical protein
MIWNSSLDSLGSGNGFSYTDNSFYYVCLLSSRRESTHIFFEGDEIPCLYWREVRDETKYERMTIFGVALLRIRERVEQDLSLAGMPRQKILAAIVRLMEATLIRVGNEEYARENHSYGLTTMRNKHVQVKGSSVTFKFQGKSGVRHTVCVLRNQLLRVRWLSEARSICYSYSLGLQPGRE